MTDPLVAVLRGGDPELVIAGLLHDSIEDSETSEADIERDFGAAIASLVAEVTDDRSLERHVRKRLQVERAAAKSARARMIKLADKTSNLRAMVKSPPKDWSASQKQEYLDFAHDVAAGCRGVNDKLEAWFDEAYAAGEKALG
jgi:(p)ppGpp synthase/HD superfamily hydrolase